jgi:hypothetical protein
VHSLHSASFFSNFGIAADRRAKGMGMLVEDRLRRQQSLITNGVHR